MNRIISDGRNTKVARRLWLAFMLAATFGGEARAQATEHYPDIRLVYGDLKLDTPAGRRAFVERVETTATIHCARYGPLIAPHERRAQPRYCAHAVRGEILRALSPSLRAVHDAGQRQMRESANLR